MHTLRTQDRDRKMDVTVSFERVPMFRGIAFALRDIQNNGAPIDIFSADRRDAIVGAHNKSFGTGLHGQAYLYRNQNRPGFNPANPPSQTSHCLFADATIAAVLTRYGTPTKAGDVIPWWALGLDISDHGKHEDVSRFLFVAAHLGYRFVQPYGPASSERHHVILVRSPISNLEHRNQISKERTA